MDQCKPCVVKGNLEKCLETDCNYHNLWMVKEVRRLLENEAVLANAMLESISSILDGKQVNDFELSFPVVRRVWDVVSGDNAQQAVKVDTDIFEMTHGSCNVADCYICGNLGNMR